MLRSQVSTSRRVPRVFLGVAVLAMGATSAFGNLIADRATLDGLLGANAVMEDFEAVPVPGANDVYSGSRAGEWFSDPALVELDATTTWTPAYVYPAPGLLGPGLVQPGATYTSTVVPGGYGLVWLGDGYDGYDPVRERALTSRTLLAEGNMTITYDSPVVAMGLDVANYSNGMRSVLVDVYDPQGLLLASASINVGGLGSDPTSTFFGYEASAIGSVVISDPIGEAIIDNVTYGVPEPAGLALLAVGAMIGFKRR